MAAQEKLKVPPVYS